jgi:hypothetical protein
VGYQHLCGRPVPPRIRRPHRPGNRPGHRHRRGESLSTLEAANLDGDGVPDLWAVTPDGVARAYLISHLSANGPAEIEPQKPQKLS